MTRSPEAIRPGVPAVRRGTLLVGLPALLGLLVLGLGLLGSPWLVEGEGWGLRWVLGLAGAAVVLVLLLRCAVWRWLAAIAAACVPLSPLVLRTPQPALPGMLALVLAAAAILVWCWRLPSGRLRQGVAAGVGLLALVVLLLGGPVPATQDGLRPWVVVAALVCLAPAAGALLGLGRARGSALRPVVGVLTALTVAPLLARLVDPGWSAQPTLALSGLAPAAAALALTALLRGRRGAAVLRPQSDDVDAAALADFDERYDVPRLGPVTIVIAAYNEAGGLPAVLSELPRSLSGQEVSVLVVDDGSTDETATAVLAHPAAYLVAPGANRGQGAALRLGYRVAREHGARFVVSTDADGQYDPADLPRLLAPLLDGTADFVTGSRRLGHQDTRDRFRRLGVHVFAWAVRLLTGEWVTDTSFGMRAMRAEVTATVTLNQPQYQSSELMLGVHSHGFRIAEVPGTMRVRSAGSTKKGRNLVYGGRYARVVLGTWWREGCPAPVTDRAPALRALPAEVLDRRAALLRDHRPFLVALGLGVAVRVLVQAAFMPAFVFSDGPTYLSFVDQPMTNPERPVGYPLLVLAPLLHLDNNLVLVAVVQHLAGLATAVILYLLLRHWGVGRRLAMLATLPVLFDTLALVLEHSVLSDTLFVLLLVGAIAVLGWRRQPTPGAALVAGLLLGACTVVRLVGEPLVLVAAAFCLLVGTDWARRVAGAAAVVLGFALPVGAYLVWYHADHGSYALSEFGGKSYYLRTTPFVDCAKLSIPDYQRVLCPAEPVGERRDPTYYVFHSPDTLPRLQPPPGVSQDQALREFASSAVAAQPLAYLGVVGRDFLLNFDVVRVDRFEFDTAHKWGFTHYVDVQPTSWTGPAYAAHGGRQLDARAPYAQVLAGYSALVYVPGPVLFGCLLVGLAAGCGLGAARTSGSRSVCLLLTVTGAVLVLAPAVTAEFVWRYQLPALALLPAGAAVGLVALRSGQPRSGTQATARTDWPNGGRIRRSTARVTGTTRRS